MIESGQLLERFRLLARDIQNGLQTAQRQLEPLKRGAGNSEAIKIAATLSQMSEAWQDFSGWILLSTLDDPNEARANSAPGRIDVRSKIIRSKIRAENTSIRNGIKIDISDVQSLIVETYIPYLEQTLDLIFDNSIKYSPRGGTIEVSVEREKSGATIMVRSVGPNVQRYEIEHLGTKGFRSEGAKKASVAGQGFGLFNVRRLVDLLDASVEFRAEQKILYESSNTQYSNFTVILKLPEAPKTGGAS